MVDIKQSNAVFKDNYGQNCGGITLWYSWLTFSGNSTTNNVGNKGGALSLSKRSTFRCATKAIQEGVNFISNSAII